MAATENEVGLLSGNAPSSSPMATVVGGRGRHGGSAGFVMAKGHEVGLLSGQAPTAGPMATVLGGRPLHCVLGKANCCGWLKVPAVLPVQVSCQHNTPT